MRFEDSIPTYDEIAAIQTVIAARSFDLEPERATVMPIWRRAMHYPELDVEELRRV
ncbi:MAG: hypothetical protein M3Y21_05335 [Candidatus Eremiobacteraeota bacterium]|nr:hypothetical protein [Candidatus Eremiobacteraeota bacterium]